jgi:hypothetical protein
VTLCSASPQPLLEVEFVVVVEAAVAAVVVVVKVVIVAEKAGQVQDWRERAGEGDLVD